MGPLQETSLPCLRRKFATDDGHTTDVLRSALVGQHISIRQAQK